MNNQTFFYSVLRYRHSYFLSEKVNAGLLFFFPEEDRVDFLYPNHLQRISQLYSDFSVIGLRKYLHAFDKQAKKLTKTVLGDGDLFEYSDFKKIISKYFLVEDSTSLFFSEIKEGTYKDAKQTLKFYQDRYLSVYEKRSQRNRKDERYILNRVEDQLKLHKLNYSEEIRKDYVLKTPYLTRTFNYAWKNGSTNLVTPVGLDLKQKESIERKACTWRGRLETFSTKATENNLKFDLIVSRPADKHLFKTYDNVLKILENNEAPKDIIEVDKLDSYIDRISNDLAHSS